MSNNTSSKQIEVKFKVTLFNEDEFKAAETDLAKEKDTTFAAQEIELGEERLIAVMGRTQDVILFWAWADLVLETPLIF